MHKLKRFATTAQLLGTTKAVRFTLLIWIITILIGNGGATLFAEMNNGYGLLDFAGYANLALITDPWLTPSESYTILKGYTDTGRSFYYWFLLVDLLIPLTGGLFFTSAFSLLYTSGRLSYPAYFVSILSPILFVISDYLENLSIFMMLIQLPEEISILAILTTTFLTSKFILSFTNCIVIGVFYFRSLQLNRHTGPSQRPQPKISN